MRLDPNTISFGSGSEIKKKDQKEIKRIELKERNKQFYDLLIKKKNVIFARFVNGVRKNIDRFYSLKQEKTRANCP